jgi:hypothetical protein
MYRGNPAFAVPEDIRAQAEADGVQLYVNNGNSTPKYRGSQDALHLLNNKSKEKEIVGYLSGLVSHANASGVITGGSFSPGNNNSINVPPQDRNQVSTLNRIAGTGSTLGHPGSSDRRKSTVNQVKRGQGRKGGPGAQTGSRHNLSSMH